MKTKTTKKPSSSKRRSHGKKAGTGRIGTKQAEAEMDCPYVAVALKCDEERTRSTYKTADEAYAHAQEKIGSLARTQNKRLTFAICKVIEIVEPVTPNVARRAPKKGDGTPPRRPDFMFMAPGWSPMDNCRCTIDDLVKYSFDEGAKKAGRK